MCEDGREYYAVNRDMPVRRIRRRSWLMENVVPGLPQPHGDRVLHLPDRALFDHTHPSVKSRDRIADEVREFLLSAHPPRLWGYYPSYDHVTLAQLWGTMSDLPPGIPQRTNDIQQEIELHGHGFFPPLQATGLHNALLDARHNVAVLKALRAHQAAA